MTQLTSVDALRSSVERLHALASPLTEEALTAGAYPTEWTVAQVLSHLGSGAVITQRRLDDGLPVAGGVRSERHDRPNLQELGRIPH